MSSGFNQPKGEEAAADDLVGLGGSFNPVFVHLLGCSNPSSSSLLERCSKGGESKNRKECGKESEGEAQKDRCRRRFGRREFDWCGL